MNRRPTQSLGHVVRDRSAHFTADLLAAIFTWGGIGWLLDRTFDTGPLLMVIGFVVGNATGLFVLYIRTRDSDTGTTSDPPRPDGAEDRTGNV